MKWDLILGSEGIYWFEAKTPVGDLVVEYPNPMEVADWEARWYRDSCDCEGALIATGKGPEACKQAAIKAMRKRAAAWSRAFR